MENNQDMNIQTENNLESSQNVNAPIENNVQNIVPPVDNNINNNQYPPVNNYENNNSSVPNNSNQKIIFGLLAIIIVGIICFVVYDKFIKDDNSNSGSNNSKTEEKEEKKETPAEDTVDNSKKDMLKETAVSAINGVRLELTVANKLEAGDYLFTNKLIDGKVNSPLGGSYQLISDVNACNSKIGEKVCKSEETLVCKDEVTSYVHIEKEDIAYHYSICLTAGSGNKYINLGSETDLLNTLNYEMIK